MWCWHALTWHHLCESLNALIYLKIKCGMCNFLQSQASALHTGSINRVLSINKTCTCCASQFFSSIPAGQKGGYCQRVCLLREMDLCKIPQSLISLISASAHSLSALLNKFINHINDLHTSCHLLSLWLPLQPPLALMLLFSHSCLTFTFPCWLSHRIDNRGLSGCQDNRIGLHRDHMNGNVDWTWVTLCLAVANTNNAGTHEYIKDHQFESPRQPQSWGRKINLREIFIIIAANLASVCYTEADTKTWQENWRGKPPSFYLDDHRIFSTHHPFRQFSQISPPTFV